MDLVRQAHGEMPRMGKYPEVCCHLPAVDFCFQCNRLWLKAQLRRPSLALPSVSQLSLMVHKCPYGGTVTVGSTTLVNFRYTVHEYQHSSSTFYDQMVEYRHSLPPYQKPCQPTANELALTSHLSWQNCLSVISLLCSSSTQSTAMHSDHAKMWHALT